MSGEAMPGRPEDEMEENESARTHKLKTWPEPFAAILDGRKRFEVRKADRPFAVGDTLWLREWEPTMRVAGPEADPDRYTGRETRVRVTYLTPPGQWGLPGDLCVMGIAPAASPLPSGTAPAAPEEQIAEWERLANEATPGPWRTLENIPGPRGSLCGRAAEGHETVENACDPDPHLELMGPLTLGRSGGGYEWGSGSGSHLARVTWPPADGCRERALANVAFLAAARVAVPALVAEVRRLRALQAPAPATWGEVTQAIDELAGCARHAGEETMIQIPAPGSLAAAEEAEREARSALESAILRWRPAPSGGDALREAVRILLALIDSFHPPLVSQYPGLRAILEHLRSLLAAPPARGRR